MGGGRKRTEESVTLGYRPSQFTRPPLPQQKQPHDVVAIFVLGSIYHLHLCPVGAVRCATLSPADLKFNTRASASLLYGIVLLHRHCCILWFKITSAHGDIFQRTVTLVGPRNDIGKTGASKIGWEYHRSRTTVRREVALYH